MADHISKSSRPRKVVIEHAPTHRREKCPPNLSTEEQAERRLAYEKYGRGERIKTHSVKDKKLRGNLKKLEEKYKTAALHAKDAEMLLGEESGFIETEGMERPFKFSQDELREEVDIATAQKGFELKLPEFGPYYVDYTRDGRYLLIGGRKGHVAAFDWREGKLLHEVHHRETIRAIKWFHNEKFYAVSQKKYTYIYDHRGVEINKLGKHIEVKHMEFLPYHFLLTTVGNAGYLKYHDVSTGKTICEIPTRQGTPTSMTQNKHNAIIHIGSGKGTVSLWSPNMQTPLVRMLTNHGPITSVAVDREGRYMVTGGADRKMSVWDVRMYKEVHYYLTPLPVMSMDISDTGLLGVGWGTHVMVWKDAIQKRQKVPYMTHHAPASQINDVRFCPFEDVLGYGHQGGLGHLIIPGAGEANYDALEINPYASRKDRQEKEVQDLLNKLQPGMISLDPDDIGRIDRSNQAVKVGAKVEDEEEEDAVKKGKKPGKEKNKMRGKNSAGKRYARKMKKKNIMDERRARYEAVKTDKQRERAGLPSIAEKLGPALARFTRPPIKA
ncbi:U3 small nucleolar RNA-associated protein 7 [Terfezia boudieri ATCC MYA-4762]|uniref:U three protein 7 n=1 Tax=Terfezia boudieri ATCC MYA-4762 TaxID=1051890 RepID=A0A3N4LBM5_9PEZI|nr:U3 small nucleolar RNA-associated protein 7 [Terfezia boudieri ATCC MYA-4762]